MKSVKQILLGLLIGCFLVLVMGGAYDQERFSDSTVHYFGTDNDMSWGWDNSAGEFEVAIAGEFEITCSAVADGKYGLEVGSTIAGGTKSEGSAAYLHTTITGNIDAPTYNLGSWLDVTGGTPTSAAMLAAIDCGIYESGANLSNIVVVGLQIQTLIDTTNSPSKHYMMRFNTDQSGDAPDGWFWAANSEAIAFTPGADTNATKTGDIKIQISGTTGDGSGFHYIRTYDGTS